MSDRICLQVNMELLSDAIFGSGFNVPGGEDIAVCRDERGYPYFRGSSLKGLFRESLENWLVWTGGEAETITALLGEDGWNGITDERRIQLTDLTLDRRPEDPESCFGLRAFTSVENGVVKAGTLRTAACVLTGLRFSGQMICHRDDLSLVQTVLSSIKWAGFLRSRGFGRVRITNVVAGQPRGAVAMSETRCIRYRLRSERPVIMTDADRSSGNSYETRGYISGSAVRGMVISDLAARSPEWFQAHKAALLSDGTRFTDAVPVVDDAAPLPSIKGFYEDREETQFCTVVKDGQFPHGLKRAKLGTFCALDGDTVRYWNAQTEGTTRLQKKTGEGKNQGVFQCRSLSAGQEFEGYILLDERELAPEISRALPEQVWLGADRYEGFGKCTVTCKEAVERPRWLQQYGCADGEGPSEVFYLLAVSPLTMLDHRGEPCGLDEVQLAKMLGVEELVITQCSTTMAEYGGYNRSWASRIPAVRMYDRGSIFQIRCSSAPQWDKVKQLQDNGLGIRRAEGFGQILILTRSKFEALRKKVCCSQTRVISDPKGAKARRAYYQWLLEQGKKVARMEITRSQLGSIQAVCEEAAALGGDLSGLRGHLEWNQKNRGSRHGSRFNEIGDLIYSVVERPLPETIGEDCPDSIEARLRLLCHLFDHSRRHTNGSEKK